MDRIINLINQSFHIEQINLSESSSSSSDESEMPVPSFEAYLEGTSFDEYIDRFEAFMLLHGVAEDDKTMHLIGGCGAFLYSKMCSACNPRKPLSVPFEELVTLLKTALCPKNIEFVERAKFFTRVQKAGESAADFAMALRAIAKTCNFGDQLDSQLRDRFVMTLRDEKTRGQLIQASPKSLDEALSRAQTNEISQAVAGPSDSYLHQVQSSSTNVFQPTTQTRGQAARFDTNRQSFHGRNQFQSRFKRGFNSTRDQYRNQEKLCDRCDKPLRTHRGECPAKHWQCRGCGLTGHVQSRCKTARFRTGQFDEESEHRLGKYHFLNLIKIDTEPPVYMYVNINGIDMKCEIDSGATTGVISSTVYRRYFSTCKLNSVSDKIFTLADDSKCKVCGVIKVLLNGRYESQAIIVDSGNESPPLIGRTWLAYLFPNWKSSFKGSNNEVKCVRNSFVETRKCFIDEIKTKYKSVFEPHQGPIIGFRVHLKLKSSARPVFRKPSVIPFSLLGKVKDNLNDLVSRDIVKRVNFSDWASQIVVADKKNGDIRVCCNYKRTLNPNLENHDYPIPRVDDIIFTLNGFAFFSLIDLSGAYLQLELDDESKKLTTINTHMGLFAYQRLPFGVKSAPGIFQEVIDKILNGLVGVVSYFDDILIGAETMSECRSRTLSVLERLQRHNVQANFKKCVFFESEIEYLGHRVSKKGVSPSRDKVKAITEATPPHDVTSLRSFLGLLNFYSKFLPNLQGKLRPLHDLLHANVKFHWSSECNEVFAECKQAIVESPVLSFFDPTKPMTLVCDAGPYGVGAVLNNVTNGEEKPIYMESASLSDAERNYSQLDRETLAIVFGVRKFHKFLYGHEFVVFTDCQALVSLLSNKKDQNSIVNSRFLRWILFLGNYDFTVRYRPKKYTANADALSRLPRPQSTGIPEIGLDIVNINFFNTEPEQLISKMIIRHELEQDGACRKLCETIRNGWPCKNEVHESLRTFYNVREALSLSEGCIFYGDRIFVPPRLRVRVLEMLHKAHFGVVKCKQLARQSVWWPKLDGDIENYISDCEACQVNARKRSYHDDVSWAPTSKPFERIHLDHFFFDDKIFLLIVDDYSNWLDVKSNSSVSSKCVIRALREFMSIFGLPHCIVSDNASCFNSEEFQNFCKCNNITHLNSPQYRPQSNGLAERSVGIVKDFLKRFLFDHKNKKTLDELITDFLSIYRTSPLAKKCSPASLIFSYKTNTNLSALSKQEPEESFSQDDTWDPSKGTTMITSTSTPTRNFEEGQQIYYYHSHRKKWTPATIVNKISHCIFRIKLTEGNVLQAHVANIRSRRDKDVRSGSEGDEDFSEGMKLRSGRRK